MTKKLVLFVGSVLVFPAVGMESRKVLRVALDEEERRDVAAYYAKQIDEHALGNLIKNVVRPDLRKTDGFESEEDRHERAVQGYAQSLAQASRAAR